MSKVTSVLEAALSYLSELEIPSIALAVAGVVAPIVAGVLGDNFSAAVLAPYLALVGGVAAAVDHIIKGQSAPTPPAPPASK